MAPSHDRRSCPDASRGNIGSAGRCPYPGSAGGRATRMTLEVVLRWPVVRARLTLAGGPDGFTRPELAGETTGKWVSANIVPRRFLRLATFLGWTRKRRQDGRDAALPASAADGTGLPVVAAEMPELKAAPRSRTGRSVERRRRQAEIRTVEASLRLPGGPPGLEVPVDGRRVTWRPWRSVSTGMNACPVKSSPSAGQEDGRTGWTFLVPAKR